MAPAGFFARDVPALQTKVEKLEKRVEVERDRHHATRTQLAELQPNLVFFSFNWDHM